MALFKAVVWALIFLTKLRFPPGVSIVIISNLFQQLRTSSANTICRQLVNKFGATFAFLRVREVIIPRSICVGADEPSMVNEYVH